MFLTYYTVVCVDGIYSILITVKNNPTT